MQRIRLTLPEKKLFTCAIPVRITDLNYGNHVGNDAFIGILHEARVQWLNHYGYSELNIEGIGLIMRGLSIEFKNESFYNDKIAVTIYIGEVTPLSFEVYYEMTSYRHSKELLLAIAKTEMVSYDYTQKKVAPIPEKFRELIISG